jgi:hypothetical protein
MYFCSALRKRTSDSGSRRAAALLNHQHGAVVHDAARAQGTFGFLQRLLQALQAYGLGQIVHGIQLESL